MVLKKKKRFVSGVLIAAVLLSAVPVSVFAETGQILSTDDQDAKSLDGWVGESIDKRNDLFNSDGNPVADWYQYNMQNPLGISSPTDSLDLNENIIEYCPYFQTQDNSKGTIYKDYILNSPGYYYLSASGEISLQFTNDTGRLKIEVYDNITGAGAPINSSSASAQYKSGGWDTVSLDNVYLTSHVKMIRVVLEASAEEVNNENDYINFDGLSVTLVSAAAPPIISNLNDDTVLFTEGGAAVSLDKDGDVTIKVDSGFSRTYAGGSVTASITGNGVTTEDVLEIAQTGGITLSGGNVLYSGTSIGTYSADGAGMSLSILLNANANDTSVAALIKAIVYKNTNTVNPNTEPRTVKISAADNTNASEPVYTTVNVQSVNYAPVRKNGVEASESVSMTVDTAYTLDLSTIFEDADEDALGYTVKVNEGAEETANESYSFTPTAVGTYTLVFRANDGISNSTDTYTVALSAKAPNTAPVRKSGVPETVTYEETVNTTLSVTLMHMFQDAESDPLTYKVKVDEGPEVTADSSFSYKATTVGTHTLVFKANDGVADSTETYTVIFIATENPVRSILPPDPVTGIENGTAKTASALGLPEKVNLVTDLGNVPADVTWDVAASSYDPDQKSEQTFDVEGTVILPAGVYNPDGISLDVTINVTAKSEVLMDKVLESISSLSPVTGIPNGSAKTAPALGLPVNVNLETDNGTVSANVTWDVAASTYDPDQKTAQTFEVEGTVSLPAKVINPNGVSLDITVEVTVDAESLTDKTLERVYPLPSIKGITNGTAKTVTALGIPARVTLGTDAGNVLADVIWDLDSSSYDPDISEEQIFTVDGAAVLPDNVINPNGISLEVTINLTVLEEEEEQEYYTIRINVTKRPDKVSYTLGEDLDTQGLQVTEYQKASPSNAVRKTVLSEDQYDLEYNLTRTGTRNVKVVYYGTDRDGNEKEFTDVFTVRVKEEPKNDRDDDGDEITEPGEKLKGGEDDEYYSGSWHEDGNGWRMTGEDGRAPQDQWVYTDWKGSNNWYFFDEKGYMVTGWFEYKGNHYYLNSVSDGKKGYMFTGWNMIEGKWYYFSETAGETKGFMLKNTVTPDGYQVGPDGARIS